MTINQEDYERARTFRLHRDGKLILHPGVGVNIENFHNLEVDCLEKRAELGVKADQIVFITVGELIDRKNHDILIDAMKKINRSDVILLITGAGVNMSKLQSRIDSEGLKNSVKLLGYRTDIKELLKASDCFVFPSFQEGLPGALMEAMASGLPCVASNIRGNTDALGDSEFMFSPDNCDQLVLLMKKMLDSNVRYAEAEKNKTRVLKFDISESIKAYKMIYSHLMNR